MVKPIPSVDDLQKDMPEVTENAKEIPQVTDAVKEAPETGDPENTVYVGNTKFTIQPTLLKYQRDRTASFYHIVESYPLPDILAMNKGVFDPNRDGDKCMFDWLIAVLDHTDRDDKKGYEELIAKIKANYDYMDSEFVDRCLTIFKKLNGITEKEDQAKNQATKGKKV